MHHGGNALQQEAIHDLICELDYENWTAPCAIEAQLVAIGPAAVPPLCPILSDGSSAQRWRVARILGRIQDERAVPALCAALAVHRESLRRGRVLLTLRERRPNREVLFRLEVAAALGAIGSPLAAVSLCASLSDPSEAVCRAAQQALIRIGAPAVWQLGNVITWGGYRRHARQLAAAALGAIADVRGIAPLCRLLDHPDRELRLAAAEALAQFSHRNPAPQLRSAVAPLRSLLALHRLPLEAIGSAYRHNLEAHLAQIERRVPNFSTLPLPATAPGGNSATLPRPAGPGPHETGLGTG